MLKPGRKSADFFTNEVVTPLAKCDDPIRILKRNGRTAVARRPLSTSSSLARARPVVPSPTDAGRSVCINDMLAWLARRHFRRYRPAT